MVRVRHVWPAVLLIAAATARSSPGNLYFYNYSGDQFPEVEGPWVRYYGGGGAVRSIENGALVLDSR